MCLRSLRGPLDCFCELQWSGAHVQDKQKRSLKVISKTGKKRQSSAASVLPGGHD